MYGLRILEAQRNKQSKINGSEEEEKSLRERGFYFTLLWE